MITSDDISAYLLKAISNTDTRFVTGEDQGGYVDFELDDAIIRVMLNQSVVRRIVIPERETKLSREELFKKYALPAISEFITEFRNKAKRVVVTAPTMARRDPNLTTTRSRNAAVHLAVSSVMHPTGEVYFTIEMKFGTFRI